MQATKRLLAPVLEKMELNSTETFPAFQFGSLETTIYRIQTKSSKRFKKSKNGETIIVTRIK